MTAKSHSFSTKNESDTMFIESLRIRERLQGRANFSWVILQALKDYAIKVEEEDSDGRTNKVASVSALKAR